MDKTKFTLGKFSFPVFFSQPTVQNKKNANLCVRSFIKIKQSLQQEVSSLPYIFLSKAPIIKKLYTMGQPLSSTDPSPMTTTCHNRPECPPKIQYYSHINKNELQIFIDVIYTPNYYSSTVEHANMARIKSSDQE
jgi:hypothetical protein